MAAARAGDVAVQPDATAAPSHERPGALMVLLGLAVIAALAYAAPILIGLSSPLHLLIAGFALYEAWKLNKRLEIRITGPFQLGAPRRAAA